MAPNVFPGLDSAQVFAICIALGRPATGSIAQYSASWQPLGRYLESFE